MKRNATIKIDGAKLKEIIKTRLGVNLYQFSINNGFSKNYMQKICTVNRATASTIAVLKLNGIELDEYVYKEPEIKEPERTQVSIEDIEAAKREELKALVKEAVIEALHSFNYVKISGIDYDPKNRRYKLFVNEEDFK